MQEQSTIPTSPTLLFLSAVGALIASGAIPDLIARGIWIRGERARNIRVWLSTATGVGLVAAGFFWKNIAAAMPTLGASVGAITSDARYWFGLFVVGYVGIQGRASWREWLTRPKRVPLPANIPVATISPPVSIEERSAIQPYRTFWRKYGKSAPGILSLLYEDSRDAVKSKSPQEKWVTLLHHSDDLKNKAVTMTAAVADNSTATLVEVKAAMNNLYASYRETAIWYLYLLDREYQGLSSHVTDALRLEAWPQAAKEFREKLEELDCEPDAKLLIHEVTGHNQSLSAFLAGTFPPNEYPILKRLKRLTKDENEFINLFARVDLPMKAGDDSTMMSHAVYAAGERLVGDMILVSEELEDSVIRFSLPATTANLWWRSGRDVLPCKTTVDIPLSLVAGTGSSGSGAGPSYLGRGGPKR